METFHLLVRRLFTLFLTIFALIAVIFAGLLMYKPSPSTSVETLVESTEEWRPKDVLAELENMPEDVKYGYELIAESSRMMGPDAEDPGMRFTGNGLACANCHLQAGTQAGSGSWVGVTDRFPQFRGRSNQIGTIQDRINGCMERSMNGRKLPDDIKEMNAIVAYMKWLSTGVPEEKVDEYKGYVSIEIPETAVDLEKGKAVYTKECVLCHGENGQGVRKPDGKGYQYPPLWGADSYNDGAGMHRVITAAEFIKGNMPFGQASWDNPKLSDEEAFHVAGYINSFERPHKENTEKDYPDLKLKPVSTPYGPWADDFPAEQHKYGPFPPIIAYYKAQYGITKNK
ncbi:c-type cytochrome [Zeaxanthinibacter enoshimensis]|uniref:Thiosulfate dehydrogenase n=1 Tax=Zeaxanthinibacter enoshimensis TaxID=392009 RepID=A0A4R6TQG9_9FLAO|nr:c-type cytochrome [Zeaxanthinibacter enoshimensis]TDQ32363.1 thiosulfate dehydrogenase [Zeaxanthinibacter enoshimensis]